MKIKIRRYKDLLSEYTDITTPGGLLDFTDQHTGIWFNPRMTDLCGETHIASISCYDNEPCYIVERPREVGYWLIAPSWVEEVYNAEET